jgi:hypothetical protein
MTLRSLSFFFVCIAALSIAYYFAIALPRIQQQRLAFEQQKYATEQKQRAEDIEAKKQAADKAVFALTMCLQAAQDEYNNSLRQNGTRVNAQTYSVPITAGQAALQKMNAAKEECHRLYPNR